MNIKSVKEEEKLSGHKRPIEQLNDKINVLTKKVNELIKELKK